MILAFDFTSWYAAVIYVVGGVLVLVAAGEKLFGWSRWLRQRLWPEPPQRPLVLRDRSFTYSTETVPERRLEPRRYLEGLSATYRVENKEPNMTVLDISSGVRRRDDGRELASGFSTTALSPGESTRPQHVSIPPDLFEGLTDEHHEGVFLFWVPS